MSENSLKQFSHLLTDALRQIDITIPENTTQYLVKHYDLLRKWNSTFNLTSLFRTEDIIDRLYIDSILFINEIPSETTDILDIGSGPGFPGIPILAALPHVKLTIIEPKRKMCAFLSEVLYTFNGGLTFDVVNSRCDTPEFVKSNSLRFPVIVSKAFMPPDEALNLIEPILHPDGLYATCINPDTPLEAASNQGFEISLDRIHILPVTRRPTRHLVFRRKSTA